MSKSSHQYGGGNVQDCLKVIELGLVISDTRCSKPRLSPLAAALAFLAGGIPPWDDLAASTPPAPTGLTLATRAFTIFEVKGTISAKLSLTCYEGANAVPEGR